MGSRPSGRPLNLRSVPSPSFKSSIPDFGNLSCNQITGITLKNTNIEMRNTKQYRNTNFQNSKQKRHDTTISRFGH